jgi:serine/threonine-protein kinase HipA
LSSSEGLVDTAEVILWGRRIGVVHQSKDLPYATFQYERDFVGSGIQVSPLMMPLRFDPYEFPGLRYETYKGLPGLLADSLPDKFGNALIDTWLASQGREPGSFSVIERLCYTGSRGMGALEFKPVKSPRYQSSTDVDLSRMVQLASQVLSGRENLHTHFDFAEDDKALLEILKIGTSAGGARAKAVIAWNPETNEVRSGQVSAEPGFEYWLIKFDGVSENGDKELHDPKGFGVIEYAYSVMASRAGIEIAETQLLHEGPRQHYMIKRFDRDDVGKKLHMQSLCGIAHFDFNMAGAYSYEQALMTMDRLGLAHEEKQQLFLRMIFNVVARNQDDHTKNIAFLMNRQGEWSLAPAYDLTFSYNPNGAWTARHQMSIQGKRDDFTREDLLACAKVGSIRPQQAKDMIDQVVKAVRGWQEIMFGLLDNQKVKVPDALWRGIEKHFRLNV